MRKLSERAQLFLGIIRESTVIDDGVVSKFRAPGRFIEVVYGEHLKRPLWAFARGDSHIMAALERRGLVRLDPLPNLYDCTITEEGILEYERIAQERRGSC